jgi:DNA-directed RNA polymerase subunit RPC12/RpoP
MIECPKCGSRYLRPAKSREFSERIGRLWFRAPMRCLDCSKRFIAATFRPFQIRFARCPTCMRKDLSTWSDQHFDTPLGGRLKMFLGGRRWRCEYCRLNFVSLRKRKEVFSFRRWGRYQPRAEQPARQEIRQKNVQGSRHD